MIFHKHKTEDCSYSVEVNGSHSETHRQKVLVDAQVGKMPKHS